MSTSTAPRSTGVHPTRQQLDELDALLQRMLALPVSSVEEESEARKPTETPPQAATDRPEAHVLPMPNRPPAEPLPAHDDEGEHGDDEAWVPLRSTWQPSAQTWGPLAKQWQEAQQAAQAAPAAREPNNDVDTTFHSEKDSADQRGTSENVRRADRPALPTSWQVDARANEPLEPLPSLKGLLPAPSAAPAPKSTEPAQPAAAPLSVLLYPCFAVTAVFDTCLAALGPLGRPLRAPAGKTTLGVVGALCLVAAAVVSVIDWFGWTW